MRGESNHLRSPLLRTPELFDTLLLEGFAVAAIHCSITPVIKWVSNYPMHLSYF